MTVEHPATENLLQREVAEFGRLFEETLRGQVGDEAIERIHRVRQFAIRRRSGEPQSEQELARSIVELTPEHMTVLARATTILFDLVNLAEDRQRVRVVRERERKAHPGPRPESIGHAIARLRDMGLDVAQMEQLLSRLSIELVLTAHPTEAKRRSVRHKLRRVRQIVAALDDVGLLPGERRRLTLELSSDFVALWQSDLLRPSRPSVHEEVERGLFVLGELWHVIPALYRDLSEALATAYPGHVFEPQRFLSFGSWIGGDRDGNPFVTTEVTAGTLELMRRAAVEHHLRECRRRLTSLSISARQAQVSPELLRATDAALARWPDARQVQDRTSPVEAYRRWLKVIQWRLERTAGSLAPGGDPGQILEGAYRAGHELVADLSLMTRSLAGHNAATVAEAELEDWICNARVFGLHMACLDVRQESLYLRRVLGSIFQKAGLCNDFNALDGVDRLRLLHETISQPLDLVRSDFPEEVRQTVNLFRLLVQTSATFGRESLGAFVISMTHDVADVVAVVWFLRQAVRLEGLEHGTDPVPISPLFETIDDLRRAPAILDAMLGDPIYREHLRQTGSHQIVMVGYSDSTKDGGYLAANWMLYRAQAELHEVAERHGIALTVFHGRGGALGRGGGPAARGVMSLPHHVVNGSIRMTEQGEVLAERYDDPQIARRHLEQITWATLLVSAAPEEPVSARWIGHMDRLCETALGEYRRLVEHPSFIDYFVRSTPIEWIEQMPIASRPARRGSRKSLSDLRAIPWVFAWTQSRAMFPAWFGLGTAVENFVGADGQLRQELRAMYRDWSFFKATVDNAALALAKADTGIARAYAGMMGGSDGEEIWSRLDGEFRRSRAAVLEITEQPDLLSELPWLRDSIRQRNPLVDPLNFLQVRVMQQLRDGAPSRAGLEEELSHLMRLTIQGIAAGMRTTG